MDDLVNLDTIFSKALYRVPDYQRGYSWGDDELNDLWDDLESFSINQDHYTGMISLKRITPDEINDNPKDWAKEEWLAKKGYKIYEIVDGQQRLTTLIILINEILNYCKKHNITQLNNTTISEIEKTYILERKPGAETIIKTYKFGYEVDDPSYNFFRIKILGDTDIIKTDETLYTYNLNYAKEFFASKIENVTRTNTNAIEEVFQKVTLNLKFNIHEIKNDFNVFVAFETMNNRGKPLSSLELLKNRLIYLTTLFENTDNAEDKKDEIDTVHKEINDTWKDIYKYLGQSKDAHLEDDEFLRLHWIIYFGFNTRKDQDNKTITFSEFLLKKYFIQQRINNNYRPTTITEEDSPETITLDSKEEQEYEEDGDENEEPSINNLFDIRKPLTLEDIKDYISSLRKIVPYWYKTHNPEELDDGIAKHITRLKYLGYVNSCPLVTVILLKYSNPEHNELIKNCLKQIERFNFLHYGLDGWLTSYKNSTFYNLARDLYHDRINIDEVLRNLNNIYCLSPNNVVKTSGILEKFEKLFKRDGFYSWYTLKYLLYIYDISKTTTPSERLIEPGKYFAKDKRDRYSVEHILPQKAKDAYWTSRFKEYNEKECKALSSSLGNMLPLSASINSTLQNKPFSEKVLRYKNGSKSEREVASWEGGEWKPECILDRGMQILKFMEQEFNFRFPNDLYRKKVLGLDFMATEEDEESHVTKPSPEEETDERVYDAELAHKLFSITDSDLTTPYLEIDKYCATISENVRRYTTPRYIGYREKHTFVEMHFYKDRIHLLLYDAEYNDPEKKTVKLQGENYDRWPRNVVLDIFPGDDIEYVKSIIKQSYDHTMKH